MDCVKKMESGYVNAYAWGFRKNAIFLKTAGRCNLIPKHLEAS